MREVDRTGSYLALVAMTVFWGLSFVATKVALESIPTFTLVFARFGLSSCFFALLMVRWGFPRLSAGDHGRIFLTALFEPGLYFIFETVGLQYTTAPKAALMIATVPVSVAVFAALFLGERTNVAGLLGIGTSLLGIAILVGGDPRFDLDLGGSLKGDLLIIGAVVSASLYTVCARAAGRRSSALQITSLQVMYGTLMYAPAFLWEVPGLHWSAVTGRSLAAVAYLTLFATIAAFLCYNHALTRIPAPRAAVFINGIPVVTAAGAWVILGETLTALQVGGGVLVLGGVFLTNWLGPSVPGIEKEGVCSGPGGA
ncbi:MAG: EamA family transporter [Deltaproteobacteria bacterium]|nr:EamA family transporter [Deltaproteobacteria bacterium]